MSVCLLGSRLFVGLTAIGSAIQQWLVSLEEERNLIDTHRQEWGMMVEVSAGLLSQAKEF